jgi:hypothetical protein
LADLATGNPVLVRSIIADDGLRYSWADVLLVTAAMSRLPTLEAGAADDAIDRARDRATEREAPL